VADVVPPVLTGATAAFPFLLSFDARPDWFLIPIARTAVASFDSADWWAAVASCRTRPVATG